MNNLMVVGMSEEQSMKVGVLSQMSIASNYCYCVYVLNMVVVGFNYVHLYCMSSVTSSQLH